MYIGHYTRVGDDGRMNDRDFASLPVCYVQPCDPSGSMRGRFHDEITYHQ